MTPTMSTWCSNQLSYNPTGHNAASIAQMRKLRKGGNAKKLTENAKVNSQSNFHSENDVAFRVGNGSV